MLRFFVATTNPGKLRDFSAAAETHHRERGGHRDVNASTHSSALSEPSVMNQSLLDSDVLFEPLPGLKEIPAPAEDEPTFAGNARVKAIYYSSFAAGELVLADDSGLEVDALDGAPGVRSARFAVDSQFIAAGIDDIDRLNNLCLLERMRDVSAGQRQARYRCVLAAARDGACLFSGDGTVEGEILTAPRGDGGFGYDPLFYLPEMGKTMAELDLATKHRIGHRGRALRDLLRRMPPTR
ncbi:XTP/dITP diphosphohydrolase [Silvibacterium bohemicum]|uniref:dITP/XTP pyrophosphatase n=1 Tax=Silvibacterium bohemicum TaxID=1577686 RepID=A0A841JYW6_9BACT|nr:non-canonical purine NTP pyrophosphatase [Silvibacterium bohemicum]MBB6146552.1 XTP/dITP diphosphohydrolase [Silvibacterium bohemicum]